MGPLHDVKRTVKPMIKSGNSYAITYADTPLAMLMFQIGEYEDAEVIQTFFLSTEGFFQRDSARLGKRLMRTIQQRLKNRPIVSMSYGGTDRVERWYGMMGYELAAAEGNLRVFRLPPVA